MEEQTNFLFSQPCYKHCFKYAVLAVLTTYKNRGVKQINYEIFKREIFGLADVLAEEWIERGKKANGD